MIVNVAMSADGKIALPAREEVKISGEEDFARVHELRQSVDSILVGIETVLADDPKLTVKGKYVKDPKDPLRVVLDSKGRIPEDAELMRDDNYLIATTLKKSCKNFVKCGEGERVDIKSLLDVLCDRGVRDLLVEGGGEVISSFFEAGVVDEYNVYVGSLIIGGRDAPTPVDGVGAASHSDLIDLDMISYEKLDDGVLIKYRVKYDD